ncbi:MAG: hypothetical protein LBD28_06345 [Tannerellaceae bacterium]|jgi:hypothetical protein|nr:hypothetical protein [Tannerellaceae bacterium]
MRRTLYQRIRPFLPYIAVLAIIFIAAYVYIFNQKIDINGDNCHYYMFATSIAEGHGYADMMSGEYNPSNGFPPGYPLLMSILRSFTDSIILQKILNGLFLFASVCLLFYFIYKAKDSLELAFAAAALALVNYRALSFATMMMSEMSCLLFSVLTILFLASMRNDKAFWKDPSFYLALLAAAYCYHIRTQAISLGVAVACWFIVSKRWKEALGWIAGFALCLLPWIIRNNIAGLGQSRYLDTIKMANPLRPHEGELGLMEIIGRFIDTFRMLMTKAIPNSVAPYIDVNYEAPTSPNEWLIGLLLCALIGIGMWQFGRYKFLLIFYALATFGLISIFSTPGGNRYITSILPIFDVCLAIGLYTVLLFALRKTGISRKLSPRLLLILLLFAIPVLKTTNMYNKAPFPPAYQNYFQIASDVRKQFPTAKVCSRKPELFYMFSRGPVTGYAFTNDNKELIRGLIEAKVDYVVIEQLGYAHTAMYLFPAVQNNIDLFQIAMHIPNPDTWLLKFDRDKALQSLAAE